MALTKLLSMSLPDIDQFSEFVHFWTRERIRNKLVIENPITLSACVCVVTRG